MKSNKPPHLKRDKKKGQEKGKYSGKNMRIQDPFTFKKTLIVSRMQCFFAFPFHFFMSVSRLLIGGKNAVASLRFVVTEIKRNCPKSLSTFLRSLEIVYFISFPTRSPSPRRLS